MDFLHGLSIALLLLFHNLEWSVLLTEYSVATLSLNAVHLHKVVCPPRTLNMERDHALTVLALDACAFVLLPADNALQVKPLIFDLIQPDRSLWGHNRTWDPHGTAQVHPFVQSFSRRNYIRLKHLLVSL